MREVFVLNEEDFLKIAVKENGELVECLVEECSTDPQIGEIYKGRIKNILPSINSIFVDIGLDKEGNVVGYWNLINSEYTSGINENIIQSFSPFDKGFI